MSAQRMDLHTLPTEAILDILRPQIDRSIRERRGEETAEDWKALAIKCGWKSEDWDALVKSGVFDSR